MPTITTEEMKSALERHIGATTGNFICQIAFLENQIKAQSEIIRQKTDNEERLVKRVEELKAELLENETITQNEKAAPHRAA